MKRREFITLLGGVVGAPFHFAFAAFAQQPVFPLIGFLSGRSLGSDAYLVEGFRRGLRENGFAEGQNLALEFRWPDGRLGRLSALAAELIERKVAVFRRRSGRRDRCLAGGVVFVTGSDPVEAGLVAKFNRPGGNLTGVTVVTNTLWPRGLNSC